MATRTESPKAVQVPVDRDALLKKAGKMITVTYKGLEDQPCFGIGWFFAMDEDSVRLKVTSTRNETYEAMEIEIDRITGFSDYQNN
ncbi:MAG: hypothetical protein ACFFD4_07950 [Candidatus Odinarchaeota archaeon]